MKSFKIVTLLLFVLFSWSVYPVLDHSSENNAPSLKWAMEFTAIKTDNLPFTNISDKVISATHRGYDYNVRLLDGKFQSDDSSFANWMILPENNTVTLTGVLN